MSASYSSTFSPRFRNAIRSLGLGVAPATSTADASVPLITAGTGVASASDPAGSLHLSTAAAPEYREATLGWCPLPVKIFSQVAASTAQTGAVETQVTLDQYVTIPANRLKAGTAIRVRAQGTYTATTGSETLSLLLLLGTTAVLTLASVDPANADMFYLDAIIQIRTAGASGTFVAAGTALAQGATQAGTAKPWFTASTTVDTTGSLVVGVAVDRQGTATDSDSLRSDILVVELLG